MEYTIRLEKEEDYRAVENPTMLLVEHDVRFQEKIAANLMKDYPAEKLKVLTGK